MQFTFCAAAHPDEATLNDLGWMADIQSRTARKMHAEIASGHFDANNPDFKSEFMREHELTSRQFNSMAVELKGKIAGVREVLTIHLDEKEAIREKTVRRIAILDQEIRTRANARGRGLSDKQIENKKKQRHEKKRKLGELDHDIAALRARIESRDPGICHGTRDLFGEQYETKRFKTTQVTTKRQGKRQVRIVAKGHVKYRRVSKQAKEHQEWLDEWQDDRHSQFFLIGSHDEVTGCQSCQSFLEPDGTVTLKIRPFNEMLPPLEPGKSHVYIRDEDYIVLKGLRFHSRYVTDVIKKNAEIKNPSRKKATTQKSVVQKPTVQEATGQGKSAKKPVPKRTPLTWRIINKDGQVYVHLSFDMPNTTTFDARNGVLSVDLNVDHVAVTLLDRHGNLIAVLRYRLCLYGLSKNQARDRIGCVVKDIVAFAKRHGVPVIAEKLDFLLKRRALAAMSPRRARLLSSFAYSAWGQALASRCLRDGVALRLVNPAHTSLIGKVKYACNLGLSVHHSAALAIGRRGLGISENMPKSVRLPNEKGFAVTLTPLGLAKMGRTCGEITDWTHVGTIVKAAHAAHLSKIRKMRADAKAKAGYRTDCPASRKSRRIAGLRAGWEIPVKLRNETGGFPITGGMDVNMLSTLDPPRQRS